MTLAIPTPSTMPRQQPRPVIPPPPPVPTMPNVAVETEEPAPGKVVRPGFRTEITYTKHDGVVKAKHLKRGQRVRAWLHDKAVGGVRIVGKVTRLGDGEYVEIEWASGQPTATYKAAYRWFDESLVDSPIPHAHKVPAFVEVR